MPTFIRTIPSEKDARKEERNATSCTLVPGEEGSLPPSSLKSRLQQHDAGDDMNADADGSMSPNTSDDDDIHRLTRNTNTNNTSSQRSPSYLHSKLKKQELVDAYANISKSYFSGYYDYDDKQEMMDAPGNINSNSPDLDLALTTIPADNDSSSSSRSKLCDRELLQAYLKCVSSCYSSRVRSRQSQSQSQNQNQNQRETEKESEIEKDNESLLSSHSESRSEDIQQTQIGKRVFFDVEGVDLSVPLPQELLELVDQTDDYDDEDETATATAQSQSQDLLKTSTSPSSPCTFIDHPEASNSNEKKSKKRKLIATTQGSPTDTKNVGGGVKCSKHIQNGAKLKGIQGWREYKKISFTEDHETENPFRQTFDARVEELKRYNDRAGHMNITYDTTDCSDTLLKWCLDVRRIYRDIFRRDTGDALQKLPACNIRQLDNLGFDWTYSTLGTHMPRVRILKMFISQLNDAGYDWDENEESWTNWTTYFDMRFAQLLLFKEEYGHCDIKRRHTSGSKPLFNWCQKMRRSYKQLCNGTLKCCGELTAENIKRLNIIGFAWNGKTDRNENERTLFEVRFYHLQKFKERNGHCDLPKSHDSTLYRWCHRKRANIDKVPNWQKDRLNSLGFNWKPTEVLGPEHELKILLFLFRHSNVAQG